MEKMLLMTPSRFRMNTPNTILMETLILVLLVGCSRQIAIVYMTLKPFEDVVDDVCDQSELCKARQRTPGITSETNYPCTLLH